MQPYSDSKAFFFGLLAGAGKFLLNVNFSDGFMMKVTEGCITALLFGAFGVFGKYLAVWMKAKAWPWLQQKINFKK
jgi:hypothetical protein